MGWGADDIMRLRALAADGLSASEIARSMGAASRSAVLSIMRRRGIPLRAAHGVRRVTRAVVQPEVATAVPEVVKQPEPPPTEAVATIDLPHHGRCKFPVTDRAPWMHCGERCDGVYCEPHRRRMYSGRSVA